MKKSSHIILILMMSFSTFSLASESKITKIMPLGDSITYDDNIADIYDPRPISRRSGYRNYLWYMLQDAQYPADFVGSRVAGQSITPTFDPDNEGHPGWSSLDIAEMTYDYMQNSIPDIVLLHIGTNDHETSVAGVSSILNEIDIYERANSKSIRVIVALIIDKKSDDQIIEQFNKNLKKLVISRLLDGDNIALVDMYKGAGLNSSDYADNIHPNDKGYTKMASVWYNAILTPYDLKLNTYPASVVQKAYIESVSVDVTNNSIQFTTEVPESGISF